MKAYVLTEREVRVFNCKKVPQIRSPSRARVRFKPGEPQSWLDSFFGKWPGDETDEDFERMVGELRHPAQFGGRGAGEKES